MSRIRFFRHWVAVATFGALASAGCFVVDDKDDDGGDEDNGGDAGESNGGTSRGGSSTGGGGGTSGTENGGSSTGGTAPRGGSSTGGSSTGGSSTGGSSTGGSAPTGGTGPGEGAVMKYCNLLYRTNPDTMMQEAAPLTLVFAGVRATAVSDTCTPIVPDPCIAIPAVTDPAVALLDGTTEVISGVISDFVVAAGDELIVYATVTEAPATPGPTVQAGIFLPEYVCSETDPFAVPPDMLETKSAPFSLPLERNLRTELRPAAATWSMKRAAF